MKGTPNPETHPVTRNDIDNIILEERLFPGFLRSVLLPAARDSETSELVHGGTVYAAEHFSDPEQYEAFMQGLALAIEARRRAT